MTPTPRACPPRTAASTGYRRARPRTPAWSRAPRSGPAHYSASVSGRAEHGGERGPRRRSTGGTPRASRPDPARRGERVPPGARLSSGEAEAAAL